MKIAIIIPARYKSKRLPKKPLIKINNKSLVMHTYLKVIKILRKQDVYITSDNNKVLNEFKEITNNLILINKKCINGCERCSYAIEKIKKNYDYFLITSCDMPFLNVGVIKFLIKKIKNSKEKYDAFTVHTTIRDMSLLKSNSVGKIVLNLKNEVIYISRSLIPPISKIKNIFYNPRGKKTHYSHHGLVAVKTQILKKYKKLKNTKLQLLEDIEWLKLIEYGFKIKSFIYKSISPEVNTKADLKKYIPIYFKKNK